MSTSMKRRHTPATTPESVKAIWEIIGAHLENARHQVQEQIRHYPPPIPACDADFNHLLAARARIGEELNRLHQAVGESVMRADPIALIEKFMLSSNYITDEAKQEIRSRLNDKSRITPEADTK